LHRFKDPSKLNNDSTFLNEEGKASSQERIEKIFPQRSQRISQSHDFNNKKIPKRVNASNSGGIKIPRYLHVTTNPEYSDAFTVKKRYLMSKYVHEKFDPGFETEYAKAYYEGIEHIDAKPGETVAQLIMRIGKYKGKIQPQV
jgi:hypothetical protein